MGDGAIRHSRLPERWPKRRLPIAELHILRLVIACEIGATVPEWRL
jgi:hypothetical protein